MKRYIKEIRFDECKKLIYIIPGFFASILITHNTIDILLILKILLCFIPGALISFASDLINDYFDRKCDKYHPIKRDRFFVIEKIEKNKVLILCLILILTGLVLSFLISFYCFIVVLIYTINIIIYQTHLFHLKEIPIIDILFESLNIPLLFLLGCFLINIKTLPLISLIIAVFMASCFLSTLKRYLEIKLIQEKEVAISYRKVYSLYNDVLLLVISFFFALISIYLFSISLVSYRIELLFFIPFLIILLCFDFYLSNTKKEFDEKLFFDNGILIYRLLLLMLFIILMLVDLPMFH